MNDARGIAEERFAKGEISDEEFGRIMEHLSGNVESLRDTSQYNHADTRSRYEERRAVDDSERMRSESRQNDLRTPGAYHYTSKEHRETRFREVVPNLIGAEPMAGFWYRLLASLIDTVLSYIAMMIIVLPVGYLIGVSMAGSATQQELEAIGGMFGGVIGVVIGWLWFTLPESSGWQASVGKKIVGLKVTNEHGHRISFGKANARYWSKLLSALILMIGFLMVAFTKRKQGLHDKIAKTYVVKKNN
jgi:uncharacterized RDD family membrane protein YckC